jgi:Insecticide toxin TcdB middle/N-terminal region/Salmonella virulence plasmid 65kDa B protein/FG-GAP repeat
MFGKQPMLASASKKLIQQTKFWSLASIVCKHFRVRLSLSVFSKLGGALLLALSLPSMLSAQSSVTAGNFQVTDAGAASYTIPLYTPPSAGNLDIKLALQYNSQSGNGVFGQAWSLTGVSSITRCPKTIAEEGERIGVKNDATDIFCLDGQKLQAVSGAYGAPGTVYRTARESYSQITSNGSLGSGPLSFTVQTKSGTVMEFGNTDDSRLQHPTTGTVRVWMLNKIADRFNSASVNSAITFTYTKDLTLGEQLLQEVRHNNGKVKLYYQARPVNDAIIKYDDGVQLGSTNSLVSKIEISDEPMIGTVRQLRAFKEYRLSYVQSGATRRSLLTGIQECATTGACLPQTTLAYQNSQPIVYVLGNTVQPQNVSSQLIVDKLGNGKQSIESYNAASGTVLNVSAWDIDGDARTDIFATVLAGETSQAGGIQTSFIQYANGAVESVVGAINCFADIDGNGVSEKISEQDIGRDSSAYVVDGGLPGAVFSAGTQSSGPCKPVDIDGDGRAELVFGSFWLSYRSNSFQTLPLAPSPSSGNQNYYGDINGDGKTDLITKNPFASDIWKVTYSNGTLTNWGATFSATGIPYYADIVCTGDFNGDGRTDALTSYPYQLLFSTGNSFSAPVSLGLPNANRVLCGDFNGDGLTDIYLDGNYYWSSTPGAVDALSQINNGLGYIHKIEYKSITDDSVYTKSSGAVRPQVDLQTPLQVVSRTQSGSDAQLYDATSYRYEGLRADLHRRGTLGFAKVTSRNETTDISVATTYRQDHPFTGLKNAVIKTKGAQTLSVQYNVHDQRGVAGAGSAASAQYAQVPLTEVHEARWELGSGAFIGWSQEYFEQIDAYGNIGVKRLIQLDGGGNHTSRKTSNYSYTNDTSRWLIGQLNTSIVRSENLLGLPTTAVSAIADASTQSGNPPLSISASPNPASAQRSTPGTVSVVVTGQGAGGTNAYTYQWSKLTGTRLQISNPNSASSSFSANLTWDETVSETAKLQVTDSLGASTSTVVTVNVSVAPIFSVVVAPSSVTGWRANPGAISASTLVTPSGGAGGYSYNWTKLNGARISIVNPNSANPSFNATLGWGENFTETARVTITDAVNNTVVRDVSINFSTPAQLVSGITPASISASRGNPGPLSANASASAAGGTGGYTYSWSKLSGGRINIINPNTANPSFYADMGWGENLYEVARLTLTDSAGNVAISDIGLSFSTPGQLVATLAPTGATFVGGSCGGGSFDAVVSVSGGVPGYSYFWSSGITSNGSTAVVPVPFVNMEGPFLMGYYVTVIDATGNQTTVFAVVQYNSCYSGSN